MKKMKLMCAFVRDKAKHHGGKIAYYSAVMAALCAIAFAAEQYRNGREEMADPLILPAVEAQVSAAMEPRQVFAIQEEAVVLREYSPDPDWNDALGQWENHLAVDFRCPQDRVEAACAGTIRMIGKSALYGGFIEIEADEYLLRYASVAPIAELEPGMEVEAGDLVGMADTSMAGEGYMGKHLHLEAYKMGESIDFVHEAAKNSAVSD